MTYKLLVNTPSGKQEIIEVEETGSYFDQSRVIWDERVDNTLPGDIVLGKMLRINNGLVEDVDYLSEHVAAVRAESVPAEVSMASARAIMIDENVIDAVDAYIATLDTKSKMYWEYAGTIRRDFPLVAAVATSLEWSDEFIDDLFIAAGALDNG